MDCSWAKRFAPRVKPDWVPEKLTGVLFDLAKGTVRDILWDSWNEYAPSVLDPLVECGNSFTESELVTVNRRRLSLWYAGPADEYDRPEYAPVQAWRILGGSSTGPRYWGNALFLHQEVASDTDCFHYTENCPLTAKDIAPFIVRLIYNPMLLNARAIGFAAVDGDAD